MEVHVEIKIRTNEIFKVFESQQIAEFSVNMIVHSTNI